jgi:hypothetical protein
VKSGTRLVVFNQIAPTDEYGVEYPEPLLKGLLDNPNVTFVSTNLASEGMRKSVHKEYRKLFYRLLGDNYYFNNNGKRVEYLVRQVGEDYILYLANWDKVDASCVLGIPVSSGTYKVQIYSSLSEEMREGMLKGFIRSRSTLGGNEFKRLGLDIAAGEVLLMRITPEK